MNKHKQGINLSRLLKSEEYKDLVEIIKCGICFQILLNPVDCNECQHSFCHGCINYLKSEGISCPYGCDLKNFHANTSSLGIKNILSMLRFKCINPECQESILYDDVILHDQTCQYKPVYCPNCKAQVLSGSLESHIKDNCDSRTAKCEHCNEDIMIKDLAKHTEICIGISNTIRGTEGEFKEIIYPGADFVKTMLKHLGQLIDDKLSSVSNSGSTLNTTTTFNDDKFEKVNNKLNTILDIVCDDKLSNNVSLKAISDKLDDISNRLHKLESNFKTESKRSCLIDNSKSYVTLDENYTNVIIDKINHLEFKLETVSEDMKTHLDFSFKEQFDFVWCIQCKKIQNGMSQKKCQECDSKFCKDCGLKCKECQQILCEKCVSCPRCKERVCRTCRKSCSSCKTTNKYCKKCITECKNCKNVNCIDCLKTCSQCNLIICDNGVCSNTCRHCSKSLCKKCQKLNENPITPCTSCKIHYSCRDCYIICGMCKNQCCKNCLHKCKKCNKILCSNCSKDCPSCKENYCDDCSKKAFNSKCTRCAKFFCNACVNVNTGKCTQCRELNCKTCLYLCGMCSMTLCINDIAKCKQCGGHNCLRCITTCHCGVVKFCQGCKIDIVPISPHECNTWLNETPYFTGVKSRTSKELPPNFEAKLFIEKMKGDSVSIGITDNNSFLDNSIIFVDQIWTLRLKTGMKYSTNNSVESYLKSGVKEYDVLYIRLDGSNLYFKVNNDNNPPSAYTIDKSKKYYLYIENEEARKECKIALIYIIKI
jgi:hypothetical protein